MNFATEHRAETRDLRDAADRLALARPLWFTPLMMALDLVILAGGVALAAFFAGRLV
ncbi:MAG TPA: hypothetical protein VGL73_04305 [Caulobacteraceae bacterium]|jgi:hypothetical protein